VISDSRLPDGRWQDVMCELRRRPVEPPLLVASRLANEGIWAEVLNQGGYEVLAIPFKPERYSAP
jgi:DNA-binding response OmpR family regulator